MRQPKSLDEAKEIYREEKGKVTRSLNSIIGSRILMAVLATFVLAFGVNLTTSPDQLPMEAPRRGSSHQAAWKRARARMMAWHCSRLGGSGHTVVFMGFEEDDLGNLTGLSYVSCQGASDGFGVNTESFGAFSGAIDPLLIFAGRAAMPSSWR